MYEYVKECAKIMRLPASTIYRYVAEGKIKAERENGRIRVVDASELYHEKKCLECGEKFTTRNHRKKFCQLRCKTNYHSRKYYNRKKNDI